MNFFYFLKREASDFGGQLFFITALSGIINSFIIGIIIIAAGNNDGNGFRELLFFIVCMFLYIRTRKYSLDRTSAIVEEIITRIRVRISDKIRKADLISFEETGKTWLQTSLAQDTMTVSEAARLASNFCSSVVLLVCAFLAILYLSTSAFVVTSSLIVGGVLYFRRDAKGLDRTLLEAKERENRFFELLDHMMGGFKEIKMNDKRNKDFFDNYLQQSAMDTEKVKIRAEEQLASLHIFTQCFFYGLMGFMIFVFPSFFNIDATALIQVVALILFITTGPLTEAVGALPFVERANVAVNNLEKLEEKLERISLEEFRPAKRKTFESLECNDVYFEYTNGGGECLFGIGPIHFQLKRGEIVFIKGGNGAGKSTFLNVILGLYYPQMGRILWNGREVKRRNLLDYRSNFSTVLQEYHLFDRLYGIDEIDFEKVNYLMEQMELEDKTAVLEDGRFDTIKLSAGQKKRLALIVAELDDREIFVFDEWAADQDPTFRKFFYEEYLIELKARGKTILAITHDDKYYHTADRVLKMEYGKLLDSNG